MLRNQPCMRKNPTKHVFPTRFKVPEDMTHRWIFVAGPIRAEIAGMRGKAWARMKEWELRDMPNSSQGFTEEQLSDIPAIVAMIKTRQMDWFEESITHMNMLCDDNGSGWIHT